MLPPVMGEVKDPHHQHLSYALSYGVSPSLLSRIDASVGGLYSYLSLSISNNCIGVKMYS